MPIQKEKKSFFKKILKKRNVIKYTKVPAESLTKRGEIKSLSHNPALRVKARKP